MALFRAIESSRPANARLFHDPFAALFLDRRLLWILRISRLPVVGNLVRRAIDVGWPGARSAAIARTRYIDDLLRAALNRRIQQIVLLGSGFDSRAFRIESIDRARVFEIDRPETLHEKRARLRARFDPLPSHVDFIETDFKESSLSQDMAKAGYRREHPSFIIWEGVTHYLTEQAVDSTIRWVGTSAPGSELVFTYIERRVLEDPRSFGGTRRVFDMMRRVGEPWTFGFDPKELTEYLSTRGLDLEKDRGAANLRTRYFKERADGMHGYEFYRIAVARVRERRRFFSNLTNWNVPKTMLSAW
jgi:methyltransferase (TIGR00027 family)